MCRLDLSSLPFGARIRTARAALGLSQRGLAEALGVSMAAVISMECHNYIPPPDVLGRLVEILGLGVGVDELTAPPAATAAA